MTAADYIKNKKQQNTTLCAAILYPDGDIEECITSHLKTVIDHLGNEIWDQIPKDESPLFWLTAYTGVVMLDYENQLYSEQLTKAQEDVLRQLYDAKVLMEHACVIHYGNRVLGIEKND